MKWCLAAVAMLCVLPYAVAMKDNMYFAACPLAPVTGVTSSAHGLVACVFGTTNFNNSLVCSFQYTGLGSDLVTIDITRKTDSLVLVDFKGVVDGFTGGDLRSDTIDGLALEVGKFVPGQTTPPVTAPVEPNIFPASTYKANGTDFSDTLRPCFNFSVPCVITLRTQNNMQGEVACTVSSLTFGGAFEFGLASTLDLSGGGATGYVYLDWFLSGSSDFTSDTSKSVWTYSVDYTGLTGKGVDWAGLWEGTPFTATQPGVGFDSSGSTLFDLQTGGFIGVTIQGSDGYSLDTVDNAAFLTNCSLDGCYVGVVTTPALTPLVELRGLLVAGVGTLLPSLFTLLCVLLALAMV